VVGVVEDARNAGLDRPAGTELYFPLGQSFVGTNEYLVVRGDRAASLMPAIRRQIADLDPAAPVSNVRMMSEVLDAARARPRFLSVMLSSFSTVALILAAVGIYGVLAFSVAQRTSEIGIRMAMGAAGSDVLKLILREGVMVGLAGTALGAVGAFMLVRVMQGLLFGVSSFDVATFTLMAGLLVAVTLVACYLPARRASGVDPLIALRDE
jgi:ABC-type antimicrobial peptide transport system permease subunit